MEAGPIRSPNPARRSQAVRLHEGAMHPEAARLVQWLAQEGRAAAGRK